MAGMSPEGVSAFLHTWGYPAYVLFFVATAFGSPLTEDLLLLVGGYLIGSGAFTWPLAFPLAYGGVLASDSILYTFGRKLREHSLRRGFLRRIIRPGRLRLATRWFARFGDGLVFIARFVPGTRIVVFASAGLRAVPLWRFLVLDGAAALLWVPLLLLIGERLGRRIGGLARTLDLIGDRIVWLILVVIVVYVLRRLWLAEERRIAGPPEAEP
jgi:membrane protein DedA with SNARE-associated domain